MTVVEILILYSVILTDASEVYSRGETWMDDIAQYVEENLTPNQVTVFLNHTKSLPDKERVLQKVMKVVPSLLLDVQETNVTLSQEFTDQLALSNPSLSESLQLMFVDGDCDNMLVHQHRMINVFAKLFPKVTRPRCLLIYISVEPTSLDCFGRVFRYAWANKFLDFSIVEVVARTSSVFFHSYNPFFDTFFNRTYSSHVNLFIDKLVDVNEFPLRLEVWNFPPLVTVTFGQSGELEVSGIYYPLLEIASRKINSVLVLNYFNVTNKSATYYINHSVNELRKGKVDLLAMATSFSVTEFPGLIIGHKTFDKLAAIVPVMTSAAFVIPYDDAICIIMIPIAMVVIIFVIKSLFVQWESFQMFQVVEMIFGGPIKWHPKYLSDKLILGSVLIASVYYSVDSFSQLTEVTVVQNEVQFYTFADIANSKMDIYINKVHYDKLPEDTPDTLRIKQRVKRINDVSECLGKLNQGQRVICITSKRFAGVFIDSYVNSDGKAISKIADPAFHFDQLGFITANAFPFKHKIESIFQRIHEAGSWEILIKKHKSYSKNDQDRKHHLQQDFFILQIGAVFVVGQTVALCAFAIEVSRKHCRLKSRSRSGFDVLVDLFVLIDK